jgi:hypothetical protein
MNFKSYNRLNNIVGWLVFAIAAFTYLSTMEWTVSLWDCGEFIPSAFKLEVSHPPGAPLHGIINHIFTMFAGNNLQMVPILVNSSAALASAFTILFLFWTITSLAFKALIKDENGIEKGTIWAILGAGTIGGLAYTFSDTFWFSAVEGEVYALSSFFTALIFWVAMKWERRANEPHHLRWMVLIFYLVGLVIGIHLLGLLVIPVVVLMYYYKKYPFTKRGVIVAMGIGFVALAIVQFFIIQFMLKIAGQFDLIFVNSLGMPFWSGVVFFFVLVLAICTYGIYYTHKHNKVIANLAILCFVSVIMGYTSYAMTVVRSYANPPIDMNDPEDVFSLLSYLSREQYGDSYVMYGPYYTAYDSGDRYTVDEGAMQYHKNRKTHHFDEMGPKEERHFNSDWCTFFPRMYSPQDNHKQGYRLWTGIKRTQDPNGKEVWEDELPDFHFNFIKHNLNFFWNYQMNYMYWRYFAWNFVGRQNDMQGTQGEFHQGNWMTGLPFIDEARGMGPQDKLPGYMKTNRARNMLFGLPFILGILGMVWQYRRNKKDFWVVFMFFFMTGIAIELYLNMPDPQPRERDYAFVGSFYVYAIWIGLGVLYVWEYLRKKMENSRSAILATGICLVAVPTLMAFTEWDDHDRSHRYTSLDYGVDYLQSCAPHSILMCNGDNDTYPLWYAQEVEGIRDDIRIVNLSLLSTDWYIDEMRHPINHAPGLPFTMTSEQALGWDYVVYEPMLANQFDQTTPVNIVDVIKFVASAKSRDPRLGQGKVPYLPTKKMRITVDKEKVLKNGTVNPKYADLIPDHIDFDINRNNLMKSDMMVLDMIATNNWTVPIYFSITSSQSEYLNLGKYLQQEGLTYRLVPYSNPNGDKDGQDTRVDLDLFYNNVMTKFKFGGLDKGNVLVDYVTSRQCNNMRGLFARLGRNLVAVGRKEDAIKVVDKCLKVVPENNVPYDYFITPLVEIYYQAGATDKGLKLADHLSDVLIEELNYYTKVKRSQQSDVDGEIRRGMYGLHNLQQLAEQANQKELAAKIKPALDGFTAKFGGEPQ